MRSSTNARGFSLVKSSPIFCMFERESPRPLPLRDIPMSDRRHHLDTSGGTNPSRRFWRLPLMLALLVVVILVAKIFGPNQVVVHPNEPQAPPSLPSASGKTVSLAIQTADGAVRHD